MSAGTGRRLRLIALAAACTLVIAGCRSGESPREGIDLEELRQRVANVRASVEARLSPETLLDGSGVEDAELIVRMSSSVLVRVVESIAASYLDEVELELRPEAPVRAGEQVRVRVGPVRVTAGRWDLVVRFQEIRARLRAATPSVEPTVEGSLAVVLPVDVAEGAGRAQIEFDWDAATVTGAVCRDFRVRETFAATVSPQTYELSGRFELGLVEGALTVTPRFGQLFEVRPEPTAESWRRVRAILESQDRIFRCGIALDPDGLEARLRELLRAGFRFRLPDSVLRSVELPARLGGDVAVAGRRLLAEGSSVGLRVGRDWVWYGLDLELRPAG